MCHRTGVSRTFANGVWNTVDNKAGHKQLMSVFQNSNNFKHTQLEKDFAVTF